ncbi:hypothetical protein BHE90_000239 [Fusarium euwallaceae]|uniref:DUF7918 domain-containing protein n=2 Tax=Fusarium solani species complex TaxID=232080 RepID=A0A3M2SPB1_9HYPO|nr:hypothetical protein CDV36_000890 [Fusarium kuroshium]RTE85115.1 hypothetical protein BHE90_000239 [Fusarium euwallaceae]
MAILSSIPGLIASVIVAGRPATEYEPPDDGEIPTDPDQSLARVPACHRYIESKTGAPFKIRVDVASAFDFSGSNDTLVVRAFIDGTKETGVRLRKHHVPTTCHVSDTTRFDADLNQEVYKKFIFAPVTTTEDTDSDKVARDVKRVQELGTIKVVITVGRFDHYRELKSSSGRAPTDIRNPASSSQAIDNTQSLEVAEKAMKGKELSHGASLVTVPGRACVPKSRRAIIKNRSEIAVFYFHYRSRDALDHEMVIPRSPPSTTPVKIIQDLTNSDDEGVKVKPDAPARVKRERDDAPVSKIPLKMVKLSNGREAIDLTDD